MTWGAPVAFFGTILGDAAMLMLSMIAFVSQGRVG